jgi:AcrR family transcriptional regulator
MSDQKRPYRMKRRAELEEQTRQRITESAVALHEELGPAQTSISAIAERAGVRRSTIYRHFPDEDALLAACSAHWRDANPPPDPQAWLSIQDPAARTRAALRELYVFYGSTEAMYVSLLRDEPLVPAVHLRLRDFYGYLGVIQTGLAAGRGLRGRRGQYVRAAIGHALAFPTWRSLARDQGLGNEEAVELMCRLVEDAGR